MRSEDQPVEVECPLGGGRGCRVGGVGAPELSEQGEVDMVLPPPVHGVLLGGEAAAVLEEPRQLHVDLVLES